MTCLVNKSIQALPPEDILLNFRAVVCHHIEFIEHCGFHLWGLVGFVSENTSICCLCPTVEVSQSLFQQPRNHHHSLLMQNVYREGSQTSVGEDSLAFTLVSALATGEVRDKNWWTRTRVSEELESWGCHLQKRTRLRLWFIKEGAVVKRDADEQAQDGKAVSIRLYNGCSLAVSWRW